MFAVTVSKTYVKLLEVVALEVSEWVCLNHCAVIMCIDVNVDALLLERRFVRRYSAD